MRPVPRSSPCTLPTSRSPADVLFEDPRCPLWTPAPHLLEESAVAQRENSSLSKWWGFSFKEYLLHHRGSRSPLIVFTADFPSTNLNPFLVAAPVFMFSDHIVKPNLNNTTFCASQTNQMSKLSPAVNDKRPFNITCPGNCTFRVKWWS